MTPGIETRDKRLLTIGDALHDAERMLASADIAQPRIEAEMLLAHVTAITRPELFYQRQRILAEESISVFAQAVRKRSMRYPIAYIFNMQEFMGIPLYVDEQVLIPRPETELLVEKMTAIVREEYGDRDGVHVVDIGTGSGAIAIAVAMLTSQTVISAVDISDNALNVARQNVQALGLEKRISLVRGDLLKPFRYAGYIDIIITNPPYVRTQEMNELQSEVRFEPRIALDGGKDGSVVARRIIRDASLAIRPGGYIGIEMDPSQEEPLCDELLSSGFECRDVCRDYEGFKRFIIGCRKKDIVS